MPIFLFTLLIAVGEDYNIILVTRVDEEQGPAWPARGRDRGAGEDGWHHFGVRFHHGGHILSLAFGGSLARMYQLGFALTFGVLLDTFVVRPILVPAYLILVNNRRSAGSGSISGPGGSPRRWFEPDPINDGQTRRFLCARERLAFPSWANRGRDRLPGRAGDSLHLFNGHRPRTLHSASAPSSVPSLRVLPGRPSRG